MLGIFDSPDGLLREARSILDKFERVKAKVAEQRTKLEKKSTKAWSQYEKDLARISKTRDSEIKVVNAGLNQLEQAEKIANKVLSIFED